MFCSRFTGRVCGLSFRLLLHMLFSVLCLLCRTAAGSPYRLVSDVAIAAGVTVRIDPTVQVVATGSHRLTVRGRLLAQGQPGRRVVFEAAPQVVWQGIHVPPGGVAEFTCATLRGAQNNLTLSGGEARLDTCHVMNATRDGVYAFGPSYLGAQNCSFENNGRRAIYFEGVEGDGNVRQCIFLRNGEYPIYMKAAIVKILKFGNRFYHNGIQSIAVCCSAASDIVGTHGWRRQGNLDFDLTVGAGDQTLFVARNGILLLGRGVGLRTRRVEVAGRLDTLGDALGPITFKSSVIPAQTGSWEGVTFLPGSTGNLDWATLRFATTGLTVNGATVRLDNVLVRDCLYDGMRVTGAANAEIRRSAFRANGRNGLRLEGAGMTGTVFDCIFSDNTGYPVWSMARNVRLLRERNRYLVNGVQMIGVACALDPDLPGGEHQWINQGIPYDCTADPAGTVLHVGSGARLIIPPNAVVHSGGIHIAGTLDVAASSNVPAEFLPPPGSTAPGTWGGLDFAPGAQGTISGAIIRYGENGIQLRDASPRIAETIISGSQYEGLRCRGTAAPVVFRSEIRDSGRHGVMIEEQARPNLGDITNSVPTDDGQNRLTGNAGYDIHNSTANDIFAQSNWWDSTNPAAVEARFYDGRMYSGLGRVLYNPLRGTAPNNAPVLSWSNETGFITNGVNPNVAPPTTLFWFRVRYSDADGDPPSNVRLHITRSDVPINGSPFDMTRSGSTNYKGGVDYVRSVPLPAGRDYAYRFTADDGKSAAVGEPVTARRDLVVNTPPRLQWTGQAGWQGSGVNPSSGTANQTLFRFRCQYVDADGDMPTAVRLHITRGGSAIPESPLMMSLLSGNPTEGQVYEATLRLSQPGTTYSYRFEADDGIAPAAGVATATTSGPTVTGSGTAALPYGVSAMQVRGGMVEIRWSLTAAAAVEVSIRNLAGREVARLLPGCSGAEESGSVLWSGRSAAGTVVPPGRYLAIVEVYTEEGSSHRALAPFSIKR